jgi:hypothetical protein
VEAFVYVLLFVAATVASGFVRKKMRVAVVGSLILCTTFLALAAPYVAFFYRHTGSVRLEAKWDINYTMARNRLAGMSGTEADYGVKDDLTITGPILMPSDFVDYTPYPHTLGDKVRTLMSMAKRNAWEVYHYVRAPEIGAPVLLGLVLIGWIRTPWSNRRLGHEAVLLIVAGSVACIVVTSSTADFRYFLPLVPLLLLWASKGIEELARWISRWQLVQARPPRARRLAGATPALCALVAMLMISAWGIQQNVLFVGERSAASLAARDAGLWLAEYDPAPKRIATRSTVIPYYANGTLIGLPYAQAELTRRYIASKDVDFLVLESRFAQQLPAIGEWLRDGVPDSRARLLYDRTAPSGERVVIYRWLRSSRS